MDRQVQYDRWGSNGHISDRWSPTIRKNPAQECLYKSVFPLYMCGLFLYNKKFFPVSSLQSFKECVRVVPLSAVLSYSRGVGESRRTQHGRLAEEGRVGDDENTEEPSTGEGSIRRAGGDRVTGRSSGRCVVG